VAGRRALDEELLLFLVGVDFSLVDRRLGRLLEDFGTVAVLRSFVLGDGEDLGGDEECDGESDS